jgi:hypothetical protein
MADARLKALETKYIAEQARQEIIRQIKAEVAEFEKTVRARCSAAIQEQDAIIDNCNKQLQEIEDNKREQIAETNSKNRFVGKRVKETEILGFGKPREVATGVVGMVEVFRDGDALPENIRTSLPKHGDLVVRVLRKDGTKSRRVVTFPLFDKGDQLPMNWRLIAEDGQQA